MHEDNATRGAFWISGERFAQKALHTPLLAIDRRMRGRCSPGRGLGPVGGRQRLSWSFWELDGLVGWFEDLGPFEESAVELPKLLDGKGFRPVSSTVDTQNEGSMVACRFGTDCLAALCSQAEMEN